jgi:maestro heat-like repeat-containing protein family member 1
LSKTLDVAEREDWVSDIGACFVKQMPLYAKLERERGFAYKCIGIVLRKSKINEFVSRTLETMITSVNFTRENERNGWATMFGFSSTTHLDIVLQRLELYLKVGDSKGSSASSGGGGGGGGLFSFLGSKSETQSDLSRATTLLAYAYVSIYATQELIVSRLETSILIGAVKIARTIKEEAGKLIVAKSFVILAQSMNPSHLKTEFTFASRNELIQEMVNYIGQEASAKLQPTTFNQCIRASHALM